MMQRDLIEEHLSASASRSAASASAAALSAGGGDDASEHVCHSLQRPELGDAHLGAA